MLKDRVRADAPEAAWSVGQIVMLIQQGEQSAENELVRRYRPGLLFILGQRTRNPALAEDLAQDTLLRVLVSLRAGGLEQPESLTKYIRQTAKFLHIGLQRRHSEKEPAVHNTDELSSTNNTPDQELELMESRHRVKSLIEQLSVPRDKDVLFRFYVTGQDKGAICNALNLKSEHFDRVIHRARGRFRILAQGNVSGDIERETS